MILYGTTHRVGDGVTTADIIAPHHRDDDPATLAAQCLTAIDPAIAGRARDGDILLAGREFGAGDHPDVAVLALQAAGFTAVICTSADASFATAAQHYGLPVLVCPDAVAAIAPGSIVRLDLARGRIEDRTHGHAYTTTPCSPELLTAVRQAHLLARMRRVVEEEGFDG